MSKNTLKMTFLPLFGHTEKVLGESSFKGSNELQMKKCYVFPKVELKTFPMNYHELNFQAGKTFKRDLKVALRFGPVVLRVGKICTGWLFFHFFTMFMDFLSWRMFYHCK